MWDDLNGTKHRHSTIRNYFNKARALYWAREGRYSYALQTLASTGVEDMIMMPISISLSATYFFIP